MIYYLIFIIIIFYLIIFNFEKMTNDDMYEVKDIILISNTILNLNNLTEYNNIPIITISWNSVTFIKKFIEQFKNYPNPIIVLDNNSTFNPIFNYYKEIQEEFPNKVKIILLRHNYGHEVYLKFKSYLPNIYFLSDPDLEISKDLPINFAEIYLKLSNKYKTHKLGAALDISDSHLFIDCDNYTDDQNIHQFESRYWMNPVNDSKFELYSADVDTTFCLINNNYEDNNMRIGGKFTMKHLPWYKNYIKNNFLEDELIHWKKSNKSSSILFTCLELFQNI